MKKSYFKKTRARFRNTWVLLYETIVAWDRDDAMQLSATLAFYMVFSFAPLLILVTAAASSLFGRDTVKPEVVRQLEQIFSRSGAAIVQTVLQNARPASRMATVTGIVIMLFGATAIFVALQDALNKIWGVKAKSINIVKRFFKKRLVSFLMLLAVGLLLLSATIASTAMYFTGGFLHTLFPGIEFLGTIQFIVSIILITILFGTIFKFLPDVKIAWKYVWTGALVTSLLFNVGKMLIGLYLARSTVGSLYGAAGSFAIFLVWIYYSAMVFFFGAEFTQVYARKQGSPILPDDNAEAFRITTLRKPC